MQSALFMLVVSGVMCPLISEKTVNYMYCTAQTFFNHRKILATRK